MTLRNILLMKWILLLADIGSNLATRYCNTSVTYYDRRTINDINNHYQTMLNEQFKASSFVCSDGSIKLKSLVSNVVKLSRDVNSLVQLKRMIGFKPTGK